MKKFRIWMLMMAVFLWMPLVVCGCEKEQIEGEAKELEYTIVEQEDIPEELYVKMEENKENGYKLSYLTEDYLYIARGYGTQESGGYSVTVTLLKATEEAIGFETELIGPGNGERVSEGHSYPYIVVKTERLEQNIVFK